MTFLFREEGRGYHMRTYRADCPVCKKEARCADNPAYPFCSERCKLIDLGAWLEGKYVIPGEPVSPSAGGRDEEGDGRPTDAGNGSEADSGGCGP